MGGPDVIEATCVVCQASFMREQKPGRPKLFCSDVCRQSQYREANRRRQALRPPPVVMVECVTCGEVFQRPNRMGRQAVACSPECIAARVRSNDRQWNQRNPGRPQSRRSAAERDADPSVPRCSIAGCAKATVGVGLCGTHHSAQRRKITGRRSKSSPESNRIRWERRRARLSNAFVSDVDRLAIFERDGWRCQLCRRLVLRSKAVPHLRAATLDHIIPISRGGTHEPSNVQLACFKCNCSKGPGAANDQLRLIG